MATGRDTDTVLGGGLREDRVRASRQRSEALGVDPATPSAPFEDSPLALVTPLPTMADPVLDLIEDDLAGTPLALLLTDADGRVLRRCGGTPDLRRLLDGVGVAFGHRLSEPAIGTTAVALAMQTGTTVLLRGEDNYLERLRGLTIAADPVRDPGGAALGMVAVVACGDEHAGLQSALARVTAALVQERLARGEQAEVPFPRGGEGSRRGAVLPVPEYNAWSLTARRTAMFIRSAAVDRAPVCVIGESGVGKSTMVRHVAARVLPGRNLLILDAAQAEPDRVRSELARGTPVLVRHVEALDGDQVVDLVDAAVAHGVPGWLAMTALDEMVDEVHDPRLRVVNLAPLRTRTQDIEQALPALVRRRAGGRDLELSPALTDLIRRDPWPTNFHGLDALVTELARRATGRLLDVSHLPAATVASTRRRLTPMEWMTRSAIVQALEESQGNKALAAEALGMSRASIYRKIKALDIETDPEDSETEPDGAANEGAEG